MFEKKNKLKEKKMRGEEEEMHPNSRKFKL